MKAQLIVIGMLLTYGFNCFAQKNDYIWLSGYDGYPHPIPDTNVGTYFATSVLNFNFNPLQIRMDSLQMNFDATNTSYCDNNGKILFYTNGQYIANSFNESIEGSDSINQGNYWNEWYPYGYHIPQGILAFQSSSNPNQYNFIHSYFDRPYWTEPLPLPYITQILNSLLDLSANSGFGKMVYVNQPIVRDTLGADIVATRHGNGRDWWIPILKKETNCFYRVLLNDSGFQLLPDLNCGGPIITFSDYGSSAFSQDGSKFAHFTIETGLTIFDFDRCTGELNNPIYIPSNIWQDSGWIGSGLAFSPSSQFLYLSATGIMLQYNMWATDIPSSVDTVGIYDGFAVPPNSPFQTVFNTAQIGPDGKIYISCGNSVQYYHVINDPDLKGDSCNFTQHSIELPSLSIGVPNFPNYRLGALTGSSCDTITSISEIAREQKESILKVFPSPAADIVTVDYGFTNWSTSDVVSLVILNELGQPVYNQSVPQYSGFQRIDVAKYATGIYTAYIKRNEQVIAAQKFAKE